MSSPKSLSTQELTMGWNCIILFLMSVTSGKELQVPNLGEDRHWGDRDIHSAFLSTGVHSQVHLQKSGPGLGKPGSSVKLSYKGSGYTSTDYFITWVKQKPGQGLEWIGKICGGIDSADYALNFNGKATLTILWIHQSLGNKGQQKQVMMLCTEEISTDSVDFIASLSTFRDHGVADIWDLHAVTPQRLYVK